VYSLGIETSCDETSAAIVKDGRKILSNVISSSLSFHRQYGGVIPEIASRMQLETITAVTDAAFKNAGIKLEDIAVISVTVNPGLLGSLLVGLAFARALSLTNAIPLLEVDHLHSHIYSGLVDAKKTPRPPFMALVVSGGHTSLFYLSDFTNIKTIGQTQDDACGEAFDKVAKLLGLGYPGGPLIEKLAVRGDPASIKFNCSDTRSPLDFSFSGIKTAVMYLVRNRKLNLRDKQDIAASFQEAVFSVLVNKALLACQMKKVKNLVVAGGVVANSRLREKFRLSLKNTGIDCYFPGRALSTDNAAMVAGFGYQLFKRGKKGVIYA